MSDVTLTVDVAVPVPLTVTETSDAALTVGAEVFSPTVYDGAYEVTPSAAEQVLPTAGTALTADVTVHAAPSGGVVMRRPTLDKPSGELRSKADVTTGWVTGGAYSGSALILDKQPAATVTPTEAEQVAVDQYRWTTGEVKVAGIPTDYVGSAIERRDSTDLTASGDTVSVPAGYYDSAASKAVAAGSATASATKGAVSNHSVDVTPTVTRTAGYVTAGSSSGTAVTVTASELVSGTKSITANGTGIDVTEYAAVEVDVPTFDSLSWLGEGAELIATYAKESTQLSTTSFNGWTPSTTAKTIKSGGSMTAVAIDLEQYDYILRWQFYCEPVYESSATNTARTVKVAQEIYQGVFRRPNSLANIGTLTDAGNACQTINTPSLMEYYNNDSSHTYTWSASYGIYAAATAATFASSTALQTNLTPKRPSISARCSTTYQSTSNMGKITQASTYLYTQGWLYRVKKSKSLVYNQYHNVCTVFNDGI